MTAPADHTPRQGARPAGALPEGSGPDPSPDEVRLFALATERNRQPILDVLSRVLPVSGLVL